MSIISSLLTGGALIGKVCQTLSEALKNYHVDEVTGYKMAVSDLTVAGVRFMQSNAGTTDGKEMKCYAFNGNADYDVSLVFPNESSGNGIAYDLPATMKQNITPELEVEHSPTKEILIGPYQESSDAIKAGAVRRPVMKLSLNNMKVNGEPVTVSDYRISCDSSGIKIQSGSRALGNMTYLNMSSNTGAMLYNQNSIEAEGSDAMEYRYGLNLKDSDFQDGDVLSGQIHVEMADDGLTLFSNAAEPLHEAEERYLRKLGILQ